MKDQPIPLASRRNIGRAGSAINAIGLSLLFARFSRTPLWHTDLWDHVNYGRDIVANRRIPAGDVLLPLATDADVTNIAWGSQVLLALIIDTPILGVAGLQLLYAALVTACAGSVVVGASRRSGHWLAGTIAGIVFCWMNWQQLQIIRPQAFGLLLYCLTCAILLSCCPRTFRLRWFMALIFVVWGNVHGSFSMGLFAIGIVGLGAATDIAFQTEKLSAAARNREFQWWLRTGVLCAGVVLVNPFGWNVFEEVLRVGGHPNMASIVEWRPLSLSMKQGQATAWCTGLLVASVLLSSSRRRIGPLLLTGALLVLTVWSSRMINWLAPVMAVVIGTHGASAVRRLSRRLSGLQRTLKPERNRSPAPGWHWLLPLFVVALSPWMGLTMGLRDDERTVLTARTPATVAKNWPDDSLLDGLIWCPSEWSGYLRSELGPRFQPMASTHVHVIPPNVWTDFLIIWRGDERTLNLLQQYSITTVVVDRRRHQQLIERLAAAEFQRIYQDKQAAIWVTASAAGSFE